MPSFDIVSEVELEEVRNAADNSRRELTTRYEARVGGAPDRTVHSE